MTTSIVVVEDFEALRAVIVEGLNQDGRFHVVGEGVTGEDAIRLAGTLTPDVLLLDIHLPVLDGDAALPEVQAVSPRTQVVVCSGSAPAQYAHLGVPVIEKSMRIDRFIADLVAAIGEAAAT